MLSEGVWYNIVSSLVFWDDLVGLMCPTDVVVFDINVF